MPTVQQDSERLALFIRKAREHKNLSLGKLAVITGISKTHLWYLETPERSHHPGAELLGRLADALDFSLDDLYLAIGWRQNNYAGEKVKGLVDDLLVKPELRALIVMSRNLPMDRMESLVSIAKTFSVDTAFKGALRETGIVVSGRGGR